MRSLCLLTLSLCLGGAVGTDTAEARLRKPPHYKQWLCIYKYENAGYGWKVNTGNGYYGGLQMDVEFQHDHGLDLYVQKGTANNWTPIEQMWIAERAYRGTYTRWSHGRIVLYQGGARGFYPWPNTARYCGLI